MAAGLATGAAAGLFSEWCLLQLAASKCAWHTPPVDKTLCSSVLAGFASAFQCCFDHMQCRAGLERACKAQCLGPALAAWCALLQTNGIAEMKLEQDICINITAGQAFDCGIIAAAGRLSHRPDTGKAGRCSREAGLEHIAALGNSRLKRHCCAIGQWPAAGPRAAQLRQHSCCDCSNGGQLAEEQVATVTALYNMRLPLVWLGRYDDEQHHIHQSYRMGTLLLLPERPQ